MQLPQQNSTQPIAYLFKVFVSGFKSFSATKPQTFILSPQFNVIAGKNGSVMEAICFALTDDIQNMRSDKISDLLTTTGLQKENVANVKLIFKVYQSTQTLPSEVEISVQLFKDSGQRSYFVNKKSCSIQSLFERHSFFLETKVTPRSLDVKSVLAKLGVRMYVSSPPFIIMQNKVTTLLMRSPAELAEIIVDASGAKQFQITVEKHKRELKRWKEDETKINSCLRELTDHLKNEEAIIEKWKKVKSLELTISKLQNDLLLCDKLEKKKMYDGKLAEQQILIASISETKTKIQYLEEQINTYEALDAIHIDERSVSNLRMRYKETLALCQEKESELEFVMEELQELIKAKEQNQREKSSIAESIQILLQEKAKLTVELEHLSALILQIESNHSSSEILQQYEQQSQAIENSLRLLRSTQQSTKLELDQLLSQQAEISQEISNLKTKQHQYQHVENIPQNLDLTQKKTLSDKLHTSQDLLNRFRSEVCLPWQLQSISDICCTVLQVFEVKESAAKYLDALNTIGSSMFRILVLNSSSHLSKVLQLSRESKTQTTIWSLDRMKSVHNAQRIWKRIQSYKQKDRVYFPLDLLQYDEKYQLIMDRVFGGFVLTDSDEISIELLDKYNVFSVTIEGTKYAKGSISGGFRDSNSNLIKKKVQFESLQQDVSYLTKQLDNLKNLELLIKERQLFELTQNELDGKQRSYVALKEEITLVEQKISSLELSINQVSGDWQSMQERIQSLQNSSLSLTDCRTQRAKMESTISSLSFKIEKFVQKRTSVEADESKFSQLHVTKLGVELELRKLCNQLQKEADRLDQSLKKEEESLNCIRERQLEKNARLAHLEQQVKDSRRALIESEESLKKVDVEIRKMGSMTEEVMDLDLDSKAIKYQLKKAKEEHAKCKDGIDAISEPDFQSIMLKKDNLKNFQEKLKVITDSVSKLESDIIQSELVVKNANQSAFEAIKQEFEKQSASLIPNKTCTIQSLSDDIENGIEFLIKTDGTEFQSVMELSGGQKTLLSLCFLFAVGFYKKSCFYLLDEVDAALDENNQQNIAKAIHSIFKNEQVICISHNPTFQKQANQIIYVDKPRNFTEVVKIQERESGKNL